jgi:cystathionine gamma-synthase
LVVILKEGIRMSAKIRQATQSVWGGEESYLLGATQVPVVMSAAFGYEDLDQWMKVALGQVEGHIYTRNSNPTIAVFEEKLRLLEDAEAATSAASGMGIISSTLYALLASGDRVVTVKDTYGGASAIFSEYLPKFKITAIQCDTSDHDQIEAEIAKGCKLVYLETPTNPTTKIIDIARISKAAHAQGALVVVDNTTATPINQSPLQLGADIVLHSATKYLGGHADALGGGACGPKFLIDQIRHYREIHGAVLSPMSAYMLLRGMKTLALRVRRQNDNALRIATFLEKHPAVERVFYPGLESHSGHAIARKQMRGFGGVLSFILREKNLNAVGRLIANLRFAHAAGNLGAVETIVAPPATSSHVECTPAERARLGIPEALIRYSTGIEDVEDLIDDLDAALKSV